MIFARETVKIVQFPLMAARETDSESGDVRDLLHEFPAAEDCGLHRRRGRPFGRPDRQRERCFYVRPPHFVAVAYQTRKPFCLMSFSCLLAARLLTDWVMKACGPSLMCFS